MAYLSRALQWAAQGMATIAAMGILGVALLTTADVIGRAFGHAVPGTVEVVQLFLAVAFAFALPYVELHGGQLSIEIVASRFRPTLRAIVEKTILLLEVLAALGLLYMGLRLGSESREYSTILQVPHAPFKYSIAAGAAVWLLQLTIVRAPAVFKSQHAISRGA